jgi:hypothetical protein
LLEDFDKNKKHLTPYASKLFFVKRRLKLPREKEIVLPTL